MKDKWKQLENISEINIRKQRSETKMIFDFSSV